MTEARGLTLGVSLPLLCSRTCIAVLRVALSGFDGRTELVGADLSQDRVRMVRVGLAFEWTDAARGRQFA